MRITVSVLVAFVFVPGLWWLGGYDFDKRGPEAFFLAIIVLIAFFGVYGYFDSAEAIERARDEP